MSSSGDTTSALDEASSLAPSRGIQLSLYQRVLYGLIYTGIASAAVLLEAVVLFHYNDKLHVSLEYLGLTNFVIGAIAAYMSVIAGNLSDRSKLRYRRKSYVVMFGPLYAIGLFFRLGGFTSEAAAPVYYAVSYAVQIIGFIGFETVTTAWGVELATDIETRSALYTTSTLCSFVGVFIGLVFFFFSLTFSAVVLPAAVLISTFLCSLHLKDNTPINKRAFVPTIANITSTFWNSQFLVYLGTTCFSVFVNTIPPLMVFFLRYCVNIGEGMVTTYYSLMIAAFVLCGIASLPFIKGVVTKYGKLQSLKYSYLIAAAMGILVLGTSYVSVIFIIVAFGLVGLFSTVANVVLSVIYAETIDYDELLTGKKRGSSYAGVYGPIRSFVQIAGGSIPLMLMSVAGFEAPEDDQDDDGGSSTVASTWILRIWCSVFMTLCMLGGYFVISHYKIDESKHVAIQETIEIRDRQSLPVGEAPPVMEEEESNNIVSTLLSDIRNAGTTKDDVESDAVGLYKVSSKTTSAHNEGEERLFEQEPMVLLSSVDDPLTGAPVNPPPFALGIQAIDKEIVQTPSRFPNSRDHLDIRLLALYFPQSLHVCCSAEGRSMILTVYNLETIVALVTVALGVWQSIRMLSAQSQFGSIFTVLLTVLYSFYLSYQILKWKGMKILRAMQSNERSDLEEMLKLVSKVIYQPVTVVTATVPNAMRSSEFADETGPSELAVAAPSTADYRESTHTMQKKAWTRFAVCAVTFALLYVSVNL